MSNVLITYFSASGVTKSVAEKIADENGYDIFEITPVEKYTAADLDYMDKNSRSTIEMNDKSFRPPIAETCDVSGYDIVAIGFPVWWYTAPTIINTFKTTEPNIVQIVVGLGRGDDCGGGGKGLILLRRCALILFVAYFFY